MRISKLEIELLKNTICNIAPNTEVYLFGSRVDDNNKGGDIDILVLANRKLSQNEKSLIRDTFCQKFGEQKLDIASYTMTDNDPFKCLILLEAIRL